MITSITTHSSSETSALGEGLATTLQAPVTLALYGELGSGKTCFVKGLARGLGSEDLVTSPTFTFVHFYTGFAAKIRHFDLYRIKSEADLEDLDITQEDKDTVTVIEWPAMTEKLLPENTIRIRFELVNGNQDERKITIGLRR